MFDPAFNPFAIESAVTLVLTLVLFGVKALAFVDATTRPKQVFPAIDRQTKGFWMLILGLFLLEHLIFWNVLGLLSLIGTIAALVYILDVRPAARELTRR